ncbi:MAG: PIN domain-containing protein [Firmicutes bacterium]|nr:PIN domain-containing protein [Bacillota bacterium]
MRVLLDTNIVVDVLQKKQPWFDSGKEIFTAAALQEITGYITAKQASDLYFFACKQLRGEPDIDKKARKILTNLFAIFEIIDAKGIDCEKALLRENGDFEDAMLIESALREKIDCIVTRNFVHFQNAQVPVYDPESFVKMLRQ